MESTIDQLPGPPAVAMWAANAADALVRGARALGLPTAEAWVKATGLTDSRKVAGTRYVVRPR